MIHSIDFKSKWKTTTKSTDVLESDASVLSVSFCLHLNLWKLKAKPRPLENTNLFEVSTATMIDLTGFAYTL